MVIDSARLPTHLALVARRLNAEGPNESADTFLLASYLAEAAIKTLGVVLYSALRSSSPDNAYRVGHELVRTDGLGAWEKAIRGMTTHPTAGFLAPEMRKFLTWVTRKRTKPEDKWFRQALDSANLILHHLGVDREPQRKPQSVRQLVALLVQIRNKTKAHGAVGPDFFAVGNAPYIAAIRALVGHCPAFSWEWMHLSVRAKGNVRGVRLLGDCPQYMRDEEARAFPPQTPGVHFAPRDGVRAYWCGDLLRSNLECTTFLLPNGGHNDKDLAEFIDYSSGATTQQEVSSFVAPPAPLPPSETEGLSTLDVQSNVFGNLPELPKGYVLRRKLEDELEEKLLDGNHAIITLHGGGGVGKTSLALYVAHRLAASEIPHFEYIVWFSARDVDLRPSGPTQVRARVANLEDVAKAYGGLFSTKTSVEDFAKFLRIPAEGTEQGVLYIFDNFETLEDVRGVHQFLDMHTHLPNKVLITSRERAFKADYPIEVLGMEYGEATEMLHNLARELSVEALVTDEVVHSIYDYTNGHVYVMRLLVGEIAKDGRYTPPRQLLPKRLDIVSTVFERSFNKLTDPGRWVFLIVTNWRSAISELALLVVVGHRGMDIESGIEECVRLSLISRQYLSDDQPCYSAPELARVYGRKKLDGDPDRLAIREDIEKLIPFGVVHPGMLGKQSQEDAVRRFISWCMAEAPKSSPMAVRKLDELLESVAELWPEAWSELAQFRQRYRVDPKKIRYALRRAVEETPFSKSAWLARADYAWRTGDEGTHIASMVSAVDADPKDVKLIRDVALELCKYLDAHKDEIPAARRGVYLASVRSHMEKLSDKLDATGLSRLAWLFLLEEDTERALHYAKEGCTKDPGNVHCCRIIERLKW